jgi:hypothetical protein
MKKQFFDADPGNPNDMVGTRVTFNHAVYGDLVGKVVSVGVDSETGVPTVQVKTAHLVNGSDELTIPLNDLSRDENVDCETTDGWWWAPDLLPASVSGGDNKPDKPCNPADLI